MNPPNLGHAVALLATCALSILHPIAAQAAPMSPDWVERWRRDLAFAADSLPKAHPHWYRHYPKPEYEGDLKQLSTRLPQLSHADAVVGLQRIVVKVGDGHTRVTLPFDTTTGFIRTHTRTEPHKLPGVTFRTFPIRYGLFGDELRVTRASTDAADLLGGKVLRIGKLPAGEARAAVELVVEHDNASSLKNLLPSYLTCPEILAASGVIDDVEQIEIEVEKPGGGRTTRRLTATPPGTSITWKEARSLAEVPWRDRNPTQHLTFARIPDTKTFYVRIREIMGQGSTSYPQFMDSMLTAFRNSDADRLILDVRGNLGGDGSLNKPLLIGLLREPRLEEPGALWALIDRGTFSAAVMLATDLESWTPTILVGETTGGDPNAPGDSRRTVLPETGLTVRISSLDWQSSDPRDQRHGITPHLPIQSTFANWQQGHDAALEAALAGPPAGATTQPMAGQYTGTLAYDWNRGDAELVLDPSHPDSSTISSPAFGLPRTGLAVTRSDTRLTATWTARNTPWRLDLVPAGPRLVGTLRYRGRALPVVLEQSPAQK